jgi:alpha-glucosidase
MDYLKELGVDVIYFSPLFVSPSSHKYDTQDYDHIDPHIGRIVNDGGDVLSFGKAENAYATKYMQRTTYTENLDASNRLMAELVETAHQKGIKVIVDGVFNHCSHFNRWMDREGLYAMAGYPAGAYSNDASEYKDYFGWLGTDAKTGEKTYDSWWGHSNQPKLNYEGSEALYDYMIGIGGKWVAAPYNFDGWRLDMAADLGHSRAFNIRFWADFRKKVKEMNADACIWSEHYGDATDWLGTGWDALMSYDTFMEPVTWFFTGMQKHSEETKPELMNDAMAFENSMRWWGAKQSIQPALLAMNQLSNHDHSRFLTRTNMRTGRLHTHGEGSADVGVNRNVFMEATVMLMTWMGCPTLYYGDEAGVCGWTDPDNRRTYPWGKEDRMLLDFHHAVIRMRKANPALRKGSQEYLYMNYGVISYARWEGGNTVIAVFNNTLSEKELLLPVWKAGIKNGILTRVMATGGDTFDVSPIKFIAENGMMKVVVGAQGSMVFSD